MSQNLAEIGAFKPKQNSIEECLLELEKYGYPRLSKSDKGWNTRIEVFVTGKGVNFEVKSDFGMKTPKDAINQCFERLESALLKIKET